MQTYLVSLIHIKRFYFKNRSVTLIELHLLHEESPVVIPCTRARCWSRWEWCFSQRPSTSTTWVLASFSTRQKQFPDFGWILTVTWISCGILSVWYLLGCGYHHIPAQRWCETSAGSSFLHYIHVHTVNSLEKSCSRIGLCCRKTYLHEPPP